MSSTTSLSSLGFRRSYGSFPPGGGGGGLGVMGAYWTLFGINAAVFGTLTYAQYVNDQKLQSKVMHNTFLSLSSYESGRWWTVITSAFTHTETFHILFNMMAMHSFCSIIAYVPAVGGAANIFAIAIGAAVTGGAGFLYNQRLKVKKYGRNAQMSGRAYHTNAIGASGAVMGLGAVATCLMPKTPMNIMFIPVAFPLWVFTAGYAAFDSFYLNSETSKVAHAGHLGGLVFGTVYYFARMRKAPIGVWRDLNRMLSSRR